jgi:hypothetical protein
MTELAATPATTLQLIRRVSSRTDVGLSPTVLLERICEAVVDALASPRSAIKLTRYELWSKSCSTSLVSTWRRFRSTRNRSVCDPGSRSSFVQPQVLARKR